MPAINIHGRTASDSILILATSAFEPATQEQELLGVSALACRDRSGKPWRGRYWGKSQQRKVVRMTRSGGQGMSALTPLLDKSVHRSVQPK
jgi:hypothetical protein